MKKIFRTLLFIWSFVRKHKAYFLLCITMAMVNTILIGGSISFALPVIGQVFSWDVGGGNQVNYFSKVTKIYQQYMAGFKAPHLFMLIFVLLIGLANAVMQLMIIYANAGLTAKLTHDCRVQVYRAIQAMPFRSFIKEQCGLYTQLMIRESRSVFKVFSPLLKIIATIANIVVMGLLLLLLSMHMTIILLCTSVFALWVSTCVSRRLKVLAKIGLEVRARVSSVMTEVIYGFKQVRLLGADDRIRTLVSKSSHENEDLIRKTSVQAGLLPFVSQILGRVGIVFIILVWYSFSVFDKGISRNAGLIVFLMCAKGLSQQINILSREYGKILRDLPALRRVGDFLSQEFHHENSGTYRPEPFFKNQLVFENVSFGYKSNKLILSDLTLTISKGDYIGIIGPSGCGKSTIFNLMTRLYDPDEGRIFMDGCDICNLDLEYLRRNIGLLPQDFFLFHGTIRDNLLLAMPNASNREMVISMEKAGLGNFIQSLKYGVDTHIGNDANTISGGQRQRLALACLFLRNPDIIVLDEGTSSVDDETENHILQTIKELHNEGRTIISTSHKKSSLRDANKIYKFSNGCLIEEI